MIEDDNSLELMEDHRIFDRFVARFPVKFKDSRHDFGSQVFLRDFSAQGIKLVTKERFFMNDNISVLVKLPDGKSPLVLHGQVVWTKNRSPGAWEIGLKFYKIRLMCVQRLYQFCQ